MPETRESAADEPEPAQIVIDRDTVLSLIDDDFLGRCADALLETNFDVTEHLRDESRARLHDHLQGIRPRFVPQESPVRQTEEWLNIRNFLIDECRDLANAGQLILTLVGDKAAGIVGFRPEGTFKGRPVVEITHNVILHEFRGRGLSSRQADAVIERLREISPDAYLFTHTQQPERIHNWEQRRATPITPEQRADIVFAPDSLERDEAIERWKEKEEKGWRTFLLDVQKA